MTPATLICILFTAGVLFYVFYLPGVLQLGPRKTRLTYLGERKEAVYENLRDLNFEYKAGKFPPADYQAMKTSLEEEAASLLAEIAKLEQGALVGSSQKVANEQGSLDLKTLLKVLSCAALASSTFVAASTLTGTVKNGTTGKPSAGDDVVLIKFGQGMEEAARTKTDANGKYTLTLPDDGGPHLVRDIHQGVTYNEMATPGTTTVDLQIYDVAKKVPGVTVNADVIRLQAESGELEGVRFFAVDNLSSPPRTQMNDANFEFYLPDGAEVDEGQAMTQGGQPVNSAPVPQSVKNRYAFMFPLRPGTTQFQVVFHMAYTGSAKIDPKSLYPAQHLMVMLPATMKFTAAAGSSFRAMKDPHQNDTDVQVASKTEPGQSLAFTVSGTGTIKEAPDSNAGGANSGGAGQDAQGSGAATASNNRPGGGLGPPIDAPDPLQKDWPYILGGFAVLLVGGAVYTMKRPQPAVAGAYTSDLPEGVISSSPATAQNHAGRLLEALKEEIFQLEVDRKQGKVTQAEYEQAKAALDQTLDRALKRQATQE